MHFLRPSFLWLLIPLIIGLILYWRSQHTRNPWVNVCDKHLLPALGLTMSKGWQQWPLWLLSAALCLSVLALAGPSWQRQAVPIFHNQDEMLIMLDVSPYMSSQDEAPNRLTRAKYKIQDILAAHPNSNMAMLAFTSDAFTVSPFTADSQTIKALLPSINFNMMPVEGSDVSVALKHAAHLFTDAGVKRGRIILLTASPVKPKALALAKQLKRQGITLSVLGIGTDLDSTALKQLASAGGGRFHRLTNNDQDIQYLLPTINAIHHQQSIKQKQWVWLDQGRWLVGMACLLFLLLFRRGWLDEL